MLRNKIKRRIVEDAKTPKDAPLGSIAFGQSRYDVPYEEIDTEHEKELFSKLVQHYNGNKILDSESSDEISDYMKKGWYDDIFVEPKEDILCRGMRVTLDWLKKTSAYEEGKKEGTANVSWSFNPRHGASSWTTDVEQAKRFASAFDPFSDSDKEEVGVIMYAKSSDNPHLFVDSTTGLYNIDKFSTYSQEKEQIALGKIKIFKIDWIIGAFLK